RFQLCLTPSIQLSDDEDNGQLSDIEIIDGYSTSALSVDNDEDEQMLNELLYNVKYNSDNRPVPEYTQYSVVSGKCVKTSCKHSNEKLLSDDSVNFLQFDMEFQVKVLCEQNVLLLKRYQSKARDLSISDSGDIVGGDIHQNLLQIHESFFLSVMLHSDGVPLYNSKNCSGWPILGAAVELSSYSRMKAENILLLDLWIGR
ncbi:unnamed protein product, partial [Didymodactylos carnosus]